MILKTRTAHFAVAGLAIAAALALPLLSHSQSADYDVLITNGHVIDGTGSPADAKLSPRPSRTYLAIGILAFTILLLGSVLWILSRRKPTD